MAQRRILVIGAHPDDCDIKAGGTAAKWVRCGHAVRFVSVTNGDAGHHLMSGAELAETRKQEAKAAGELLGVDYVVLDNHDGQLQPTLENRLQIVRLIREFQPDLVLTHRPNDYHPDHRYTSQMVQDAAYMVTVPPCAPDTPYLRSNPVFGYLSDFFKRPYPFTPDVAVCIDDVHDTVIDLLHCHTSQFYEWLPFNRREPKPVPEDEAGRKRFLAEWFDKRITPLTGMCRDLLVRDYGAERAAAIQFVEAFEISEYGSPLSDELRNELFPFVTA